MTPSHPSIRPAAVRSVKELGHALRNARKAKKLTQADLARRSGLRAHHISSIETGATNPTAPTLFALLAALDLDCIILPRGQSLHGNPPGIEDIF
ncbi:helix-turn-helix domain-containing protein [Defluviimonas sp. SAOS-178_SWC]|uniref:helix-turn-helix domain-containing protein n=1 Tax=Defluviimonas sp. SAOS-178_SWC TaxID=3121287 RepID=UPI003221C71D